MNLTLRRTFAASAAAALLLTGAACSSETEGEASPSTTTTSQETETSESSPTSETDEPTETTEPGPAGSLTSSDDAFSFDPPTGYADAMGIISVPSAVAAVYDENDPGAFPTTIVVTTEPQMGMDLQEKADAIAGQIETGFDTTISPADDFPLDSVDGEDLLAFTTGEYQQGSQTLASAIVITLRDNTTYAFIVNTLPEAAGAAGDALVELIESVQWA